MLATPTCWALVARKSSAAMVSVDAPEPSAPNTRNDQSGTPGKTPVTLMPRAPMVPETWVPWLFWSSPSGKPNPLLKTTFSSGWVLSMPVSITATALIGALLPTLVAVPAGRLRGPLPPTVPGEIVMIVGKSNLNAGGTGA
jgi:hypothetical protein